MKGNRNIILTITLAGLILTAFGLAYFNGDVSKEEINHAYFQIADTEKIDEVTLHSPKGDVALKFENSRWHVNGVWDADVQMVKVLFATLKQIEPRRPVASALRDSVTRKLRSGGTQVTLFEAGEKRMSFLAGGNEDKTETWFQKDGDPQPFVMIIPGYRVFAAGIFELDVNGWRDKRIFNFNWRNFRSLKVKYPKESKSDFEVELKGTYFGIKNMEQSDTTKLNDFLDAVSLLFADRFDSQGKPVADSLAKLQPIVHFEISDVANRTYTLDILQPGNKDREVYGRLPEGELVLFGRNKIGEIIRRRDYFIPKQ